MSGKPRISNKVCRNGRLRDAAVTRAALIAALMDKLDQQGMADCGATSRKAAIRKGVREIEAAFRSGLRTLSGKRP